MSQPAAAAESAPRTRRGIELVLLIFSAVILSCASIVVELSQQHTITTQAFYYGAGLLVLYAAAHAALRKWAPYADPLMLPLVAVLNAIGLIMMHRLELAGKSDLVFKQVVFSVVGIVLFVLVLALVPDHRTLSKYGYTCGFVGLALLALPGMLPSSISGGGGAKLWIKLPGLGSIQPSEFAKILLLVFFASFLVSKRELFTTAGRRFLGVDFPRAKDMMPVLVAWFLSIIIVVLEKDLGTSLLFFGTILVMLYIATERSIWVWLGLSLFVAGCFLAYMLFDHVQQRVQTWLDPMGSSDSSYQLQTALFGMGNAGPLGAGLGGGRPDLTPLSESDFVLPSLAEEVGLVGVMAILLFYLLLTMRGLRSAMAVRDSFGKLFGGGLAFTLMLQLFVVGGGVTGLIPMTGLTTPFLANGGSSLLANFVLVAMLLRVSDAARRPQTPVSAKPKQAPIAEAHTELVERPR